MPCQNRLRGLRRCNRTPVDHPKFGFWPVPRENASGPEEALQQFVKAERLGFDSLWHGDHFASFSGKFGETIALLAAMGLKTRTAMIGSSVIDAIKRHPATIAQAFASIDRISKGRVALGLGAGEAVNLLPFGIPIHRPIARLKEAIEIIKTLWVSSSPVSFKGQLFTLQNAFIHIKPIQKPHPPIYVGALGRKTRQIAGELGNGFFPWISSPKSFEIKVSEVNDAAKNAGRDPKEIDKIAYTYLCVTKDRAEAKKILDPVLRFALVLERETLAHHGVSIDIPHSSTIQGSLFLPEDFERISSLGKQIPQSLVDEVPAAGNEDECISKIESYLKSGATHIVIQDYSADEQSGLETVATKIIPYFRDQG